MKITTSKRGRTIVELDGYSEGYKAYVQGAITGKVSFPAAKIKGIENDELLERAIDCLLDKERGTENTKYFGAKVIKAAGRIK